MAISKKHVAALVVACVMAAVIGCFTGCSGSSASSSASSAPSYVKVGTSGDTSFLLKNTAASAVESFGIKIAGAEGYDSNMVADVAWGADETAEITYQSGAASYDVNYAVGGVTYELHNIDLSAISEGEIAVADDDVPYITYTKDGVTMSTLDAEREYIAAQKKAAEEAAAAKAAEEAAAQQQYSYGSTSGSSGSGSVSQSGDSCIEGGVSIR